MSSSFPPPPPQDQPNMDNDFQPNAGKSNPMQNILQKFPAQYQRYIPLAGIIIGVILLFIIISFVFSSGGATKTIVFKENETREYLKKKAEGGNAEAMYKYSKRCKTTEEAAKWMKKSAEKGYARAQFALGVAYTEGGIKGIEANSDKSKEWLTKASKKGFPMAKVYCLYKGIGCEPDKDKAWKELEKSAKAGWVESQFELATVYAGSKEPFDFKDIDKSEEKAIYWMEKAANNGYEIAQIAMATKRTSEDKDEEAFKWFKKAAEQGNSSAQFRIASCYYNGEGVEKNPAEAKKWAKKAVEQGNTSAEYLIKKIDGKSSSDSEND